MKHTLLYLLLFVNIVAIKAQSSSIYLQNNTNLEFKIWTEQTGTHTMSAGEWTEKATDMKVWEMKKEIMETNRNSGVHNNETFYFNVFVASGTDTLKLQMRLNGNFIGSDMDYSLAGPGFDHPWYDNGNSHEESLIFNGIPVRVKYKPSGTDAFFTRDIVFAVHDIRPGYTIDSTDYYNPNIINVLSYNVQFLPFGVSGMGQAAERGDEIPKYISPWQDVVIVQEAFDNGPRNNNLTPAMTAAGFAYHSDILNDDQAPTWNGGIMIYSRWPIEFEDEYDYKDCDNNAADCLAAKGVLYARVNKMGKKYHIFGTHVEAGGNANDIAIKKQQFGEQRDFIAKQQIPADEAVILGGDMNTDAMSVQYPDLIDSLNPIIAEHRGWFASTAVDRDTLNIIDHVWAIREHLVPVEGWTKVWILRGIDDQLWDIFDPSDHLPVNGRFVFPNIDTPTTQMPKLCALDSFTMRVSAPDNFNYQWYKNDTLIVGATDSVYNIIGASIADTGQYKCVIAHQFIVSDTSYLAHPNWPDTARQEFSFELATVSVSDLDLNPSITQQGDTLYSSSQTGNQWYLDGQAIAGATDSILVVSQNGDYTVVLTDGNCVSDTSNTANYSNVRVNELSQEADNIKVYPNPSNGQVNISSPTADALIQISTINGQKLMQIQATQGESTLDLSTYPKGIYIVQIFNKTRQYSTKILLK